MAASASSRVFPALLASAPLVGAVGPAYAEETPGPSGRSDATVAASPAVREEDVAGLEREGHESDAYPRAIASALLWPPRNLVDYGFRGAELAAVLLTDRQLVPRYRELLSRGSTEVYVFPTLFVETNAPFSIGIRTIVDTPRHTASVRVGFGGYDQVEAETRLVRKTRLGRLPAVVSYEVHYQLRDDQTFHGVGLVPHTDPRNHFRPGATATFGYYTERRVRGIASGGVRLSNDVELLISASLYRRQVGPVASRGEESIDAVFETSSLAGYGQAVPFMIYSEVAARYDSRAVRTRPSPGAVVEAYAGSARALGGAPSSFVRLGLTAGYGAHLHRKSNVLAVRLAVDELVPTGGGVPAFPERYRAPNFRGFDTRSDDAGFLGSLDYTWLLAPALGMRLFLDALSVAPSLTKVGVEQLQNMRFAGGFGIDVFGGDATLASLTTSFSADGVRILVNVGTPSVQRDRQHR